MPPTLAASAPGGLLDTESRRRRPPYSRPGPDTVCLTLPPERPSRLRPASAARPGGAAPDVWPALRRPCVARTPDAARRTMRPRQVAVLVGVAMTVALLLNGAAMERSAETSPFGLRRDVSLAVLRPLAMVSSALGLDRPRAALDALLGSDDQQGPGSPSFSSAVGGSETGGALQPAAPPPPRPPAPAGAPAVPGRAQPPPPDPWAIAAPSAAAPLRLWVGGDSVSGFLSLEMDDVAASTGVARSHSHYRISTGLSRPDYYDWPAHLEEDMRTYDPQVVVFLVGVNDDQPLAVGGHVYDFSTPQWQAEYARRAGAVMDMLAAEHRLTVWVGLPAMRSGDFDTRMRVISGIDAQQAATRPGVLFFDSRSVLSGPGGGYTAYLGDGGHQVLVRADDGVHLTPAGGRRLAQAVLAATLDRIGSSRVRLRPSWRPW